MKGINNSVADALSTLGRVHKLSIIPARSLTSRQAAGQYGDSDLTHSQSSTTTSLHLDAVPLAMSDKTIIYDTSIMHLLEYLIQLSLLT